MPAAHPARNEIAGHDESGAGPEVVATDKGSPKDFVDFCSKSRNELLSSTEQSGEFVFLIRRRS